MIRKLLCRLGLHKMVTVYVNGMMYIDSKHGFAEYDECTHCGYKTNVRTYY